MIWIGLPAYNEEGRINDLLTGISKAFGAHDGEYRIIVYDDGSSDSTAEKVLAARSGGIRLHLIRGGENKGLGRALSYLIDYCAEASSPEDTVIIMDADATHNPEHIHRMLGYIKDGFDIVIASRYTPYSRIKGVKLYRQFLSNIANLAFKTLFPIRGVSDYSCAYRAYTARILKLAKEIYKDKLIEERGFSCMAEFLVKLRRLEVIACEVPLILRYDRKAGSSKMNVLSTVVKTLNMVFRLFFMPAISPGELKSLKERYGV